MQTLTVTVLSTADGLGPIATQAAWDELAPTLRAACGTPPAALARAINYVHDPAPASLSDAVMQVLEHEAAHAVTAVLLGVRFDVVYIARDPSVPNGLAGSVVVSGVPEHRARTPREDADRQNFATVYLAGVAWDRSQGRRQGQPFDHNPDVVQAWGLSGTLLAPLSIRDRVAFLAWSRRRARSLVRKHRHAVRAVSQALARTGRLTEAEVRAILGRVECEGAERRRAQRAARRARRAT